ncbi:hypothetical protein PCH_Pc12g02030 [Penicillium rubens Wisconsin 54-1255]|uniref:Uncharacterized protein n=1 Tax=Penicillium rubens (strain ATCC 28089 / DSM 1075 / NRRL 1951 / Wisconsin 54-1255) TaxID=500485 RepID=B6GZE5_PENRW|nr:hypothetical protein PCH_Pc12g02030 [Penicillium rubens Wisconsin 54-1255]
MEIRTEVLPVGRIQDYRSGTSVCMLCQVYVKDVLYPAGGPTTSRPSGSSISMFHVLSAGKFPNERDDPTWSFAHPGNRICPLVVGKLDDPLRFEKLPEWIRQADKSGSEFLSVSPNLLAHQTSSTNGNHSRIERHSQGRAPQPASSKQHLVLGETRIILSPLALVSQAEVLTWGLALGSKADAGASGATVAETRYNLAKDIRGLSFLMRRFPDVQLNQLQTTKDSVQFPRGVGFATDVTEATGRSNTVTSNATKPE